MGNRCPDNLGFTEAALAALRAAEKVREKAKKKYIGTEHILLGIATGGKSVGRDVLNGLGHDGDTLEAKVNEALGQPQGPDAKAFFSDEAKLVFQQCRVLAVENSNNAVEPQHIFVSALQNQDSCLKGIFGNVQMDVKQVETDLLSVLPKVEKVEMLPFSQPSRDLIEGAVACARELEHTRVRPSHLALSAAERSDAVTNVLAKHGITLDQFRKRIREASQGENV